MRIKCLFWLLPLLFAGVQLAFTQASMGQIHRDELYASSIGPYWLISGRVFDGRYCNVGWYSLLCIFYGLVGYTLYTARYLRLLIQIVSLFCLLDVLHRIVGKRIAAAVFCCIALSPSVLYFNTLQTENGLDLQLLPILLCLLTRIVDQEKPSPQYFVLYGVLTMGAWTLYPTVAFLLPALLIYPLLKLRLESAREWYRTGTAFLAGFLLPLLLCFAAIQNRNTLLSDSHYGGGLFRGGGQLRFSWSGSWNGLKQTAADLFVTGDSYLFWLPEVDFALPFGFAVLPVFAALTLLACWKEQRFRLPAALAALTLCITLVLGHLDSYLPGLRRQTPLLAVFYFCIVAGFAWSQTQKHSFFRWCGRLALAVLLVSHLYGNWYLSLIHI